MAAETEALATALRSHRHGVKHGGLPLPENHLAVHLDEDCAPDILITLEKRGYTLVPVAEIERLRLVEAAAGAYLAAQDAEGRSQSQRLTLDRLERQALDALRAALRGSRT